VSDEVRTCTLCGEEKPIDAFAKVSHDSPYRRRQCGPCRSSRCVQLRKDPDAPRMWIAGRTRAEYGVCDEGRVCTACGEFKRWPNFNRHSIGQRNANGHSARCRICENDRRRERRAAKRQQAEAS
jgi:hypothetical protein